MGVFQEFLEENQIDINNNDDSKKSNLWFHRARGNQYFINYNSYKNGLPMILTQDEIIEARKREIDISFCDNTFEMFGKDRSEIIEKLNSNGIAFEYAMMALKNRYMQDFGFYFEEGLYTRYTELDRTATQCSESKLNSILNSNNMGWGINRGVINVGLLLDIPTYYMDNYLELIEKVVPKEIRTEYHGICIVDKVIPKQFIKEMIVKEGNEIIRIINPNYNPDYVPNANVVKGRH